MGKKVGDRVDVAIPRGTMRIEIVRIEEQPG
jgi:transcription elongation GreA/GreB family factor